MKKNKKQMVSASLAVLIATSGVVALETEKASAAFIAPITKTLTIRNASPNGKTYSITQDQKSSYTLVTIKDVSSGATLKSGSTYKTINIMDAYWNGVDVVWPTNVYNDDGTVYQGQFTFVFYNPLNIVTAPSIPVLSQNVTAPTKDPVTITINHGTATTKEYQIGSTTGTWLTYTDPFTVSSNTIVYARGSNAGGTSPIGSITVSNIDNVAPVVATFTPDKTAPTNTDVTVTVNYPTDGTLKEYRINGGTWTAYSTPLVMTANGTVDARSTDAVGNVSTVATYTVSNIDKVAPTTPTLLADKTGVTNTDVSVTITYTGDSAVKEYRVNGGNWTAYTDLVAMTANGTVEARATDAAGNVSNVATYTVSNIDKDPPVDATLAADNTSPTNGNVTVTITYPSNPLVKEYRINGGAWTSYTIPVVMTANGLVEARGMDAAGNVSNVTSYTLSNIDKTAPVDATFTPDKTAPTNGNVTVSITYPVDGTVKEYRTNGGAWTAYSAPVVMTANGTVDARSTDNLGNVSNATTYTVSNIDKVAPVDATFSPDKTVPTNGNVTVSITYPVDGTVKEYRTNGGAWTAYSAPVVMTANGTLDARSTDSAGNVSNVTTYTVSNIDKVAPVNATFSPDKTAPTNTNVTVTVTYPSDAAVKEYRVNGGTWTAYSTPVVMTVNGTVDARSTDTAGNASNVATYTVSNIDKTAPVDATFSPDKTAPTNGDVTVSITYPVDGTVKEYRTNGGAWTAYSAPLVMTANGTLDARSTDSVGNASNVATYTVSNIDKTAPVDATFSPDKTAPTNGNVTVTVTYPADGSVREYRVNGGTWTAYSTPVVMTANGTIDARSTDSVGNVSNVTTYTVSNIDKVAPVNATFSPDKTDPTNTNVTVTVTYPGDAAVKEYRTNGGSWTSYSAPVIMTANGTLDARSTDSAGNVSSVATSTVSNIDKVAPTTPTLFADKTAPTNSDVTVTVTYSGDSTVKEYRVNGGAWISYTAPVVLTANDTVEARAMDSAGNVSALGSLTVNNIDKIAPSKPTAEVIGNKLTILPGTDASGIQKTEYKLNSGAWKTYTGVVTLTDGNYTINVKSVDTVGNESEVTTITAQVKVQAFADATAAVVQAEGSKSQADVDAAQALVDVLPASSEKDALQSRLDQVKSDIQLNNQVSAIKNELDAMKVDVLDGNDTKAKLDAYEVRLGELIDLVDASPAKVDKDSLYTQIGEIYDLIELIKSVFSLESTGGGTLIDLDDIQDQIDQLTSGDLKDNLQNQLNDKLLQDATHSVEVAEDSKSQSDIDKARQDVAKLPDGQDKTDLEHRLDAIQKLIDNAKALAEAISDATGKVENAEQSNSQTDVDTARQAVDDLPAGQEKTDLNNRLDVVQKQIDDKKALDTASKAVEKAESTKSQADVDKARQEVAKLPDGQNKTDLQNRLDVVQRQIDADKAAQALQAAKDAVALVESTYKLDDYNHALALVNALPNSAEKDALKARLDEVKRQMDAEANANLALVNATKAVETAEKFLTMYNVDKAQQAINVLPNGANKSALQARLDEVKRQMAEQAYQDQLAKATAKVVQSEQYKRDPYLADAQTLVSALPNGADKSALQARIDAVKAAIALEAYKKQLSEATAAVVKAEIDKQQPSIDSAKTLVNALPNNVDRAALTARLDAIHVDPLSAADQVTSDIDKVTNITVKVKLSDLDKYVRVAESYPSKANITNAINKLNALSTEVKTQYKTIVDNLAERCEILRVAYNRQLAIDSVVSFEKYRLPNYKLQAQGAVDALSSGAEKDALQARINAVVMK